MIYWAPLLHFYQPSLQLGHILRKVADESYRPLMQVLSRHAYSRITVNINAALTELLAYQGCQDVIDALTGLAEKGQIEFTGSAKYHPILPLIPSDEMRHQIRGNAETNRLIFGDIYQPRGFFPPELAYGPDILPPVMDSGYEWMLLSSIACPVEWPLSVIHEATCDGRPIAVFFRNDILSNSISFQNTDADTFLQQLKEFGSNGRNAYVITAMDAETFGHHIKKWEKLFLAKVFETLRREECEVTAVTISELLARFPRGQTIEPRPSSWSTSADDLALGVPYPLWNDPGNLLHGLQWEHLGIAIDVVKQAEQVADSESSRRHAMIARALLDRALHSCQFWWASRRPMWDIDMISRGLAQQREAIFDAFAAINESSAEQQVKDSAYHSVIVARDLSNKIYDRLFWTDRAAGAS